jgi:hypothetical protein
MKYIIFPLFALILRAEIVKTPLLPRDREVALALSAAPPAVASNAEVWVLESKGYVKVREGSNGYACMVSRTDHPLDLTPVCHDQNGIESMIPEALLRAELRAKGLDEAQVKARIGEAYADGKLRVPRPGGISYMVSTEGYTWNAAKNAKETVPPHVMVYEPYATNASLGIDPKRMSEIYRGGMPFVRHEGTPHAFIIILTPHWKPAPVQTGHH